MGKGFNTLLIILFIGVPVALDQLMNGKQTALDAQKWQWKISTRDKMAEEDKLAMSIVETEAMNDFVRKLYAPWNMPYDWRLFGKSPQDVTVAFFTGLALISTNPSPDLFWRQTEDRLLDHIVKYKETEKPRLESQNKIFSEKPWTKSYADFLIDERYTAVSLFFNGQLKDALAVVYHTKIVDDPEAFANMIDAYNKVREIQAAQMK